MPYLDRLSQLTGETAHLVVLSRKKSLVIEVCDGPKHIKISSRPGTFTFLHCSAPGKVLLAFVCVSFVFRIRGVKRSIIRRSALARFNYVVLVTLMKNILPILLKRISRFRHSPCVTIHFLFTL